MKFKVLFSLLLTIAGLSVTLSSCKKDEPKSWETIPSGNLSKITFPIYTGNRNAEWTNLPLSSNFYPEKQDDIWFDLKVSEGEKGNKNLTLSKTQLRNDTALEETMTIMGTAEPKGYVVVDQKEKKGEADRYATLYNISFNPAKWFLPYASSAGEVEFLGNWFNGEYLYDDHSETGRKFFRVEKIGENKKGDPIYGSTSVPSEFIFVQ